jgi:hypothetical protein
MLRGCLRTDLGLKSVYKAEYAIRLDPIAASVSEHASQLSSYAMRSLVSRRIQSIRKYGALQQSSWIPVITA